LSTSGRRALSPPNGVAASDGTFTDKVRVTWNTVSGASFYQIYRSIISSSSGAAVLGTWQSGTSYDDTGAIPGTTYYYWVRAATSIMGAGASDYSSEDTGWAEQEVVPEIQVKGNSQNISNGDTTPSTADYTDFGTAFQGSAAVTRMFTVTNVGDATLTLSPPTAPNGFTAAGLVGSLTAGSSDTFTVTLSTANIGTFVGNLSIANNDSDENPFTFRIQGVVQEDSGLFTADRLLPGHPVSGGSVDVSVTVGYSGTGIIASLALAEVVPGGWTFDSVLSTPSPVIKPLGGTTGTLEFSWVSIPSLPHTFTYRLIAPNDETAPRTFSGTAAYRTSGPEATVTTGGDTVSAPLLHHDADQNGDWSIGLSPELTRMIQFFNAGSYHVQAGTEDGYDPGIGSHLGTPHDTDQNGNWSISLSPELTRLIQFFNADGYHRESGTEDGFAPDISRGASSGRGGLHAARTFSVEQYPGETTVDVSVTIAMDDSSGLAALAVFETIPSGWTYESVVSTSAPEIKPASGAAGELQFGWIYMPSIPVTLTYRITVPSGSTQDALFSGDVRYRLSGGEITEPMSDSVLPYGEVGSVPWVRELQVTNALQKTLEFGMAESATDGFDNGIDMDTSPEPPDDYGAAYLYQQGMEYQRDMRSVTAADSWFLVVSADLDQAVSLSWTTATDDWPAGVGLSMVPATISGTPLADSTSVDLTISGSQEVSAGTTAFFVIMYGQQQQVQLSLVAGWNQISLPLEPTDTSVAAFLAQLGASRGEPTMRDGMRGTLRGRNGPTMWEWNSALYKYVVATELHALTGYWVYVTVATDVAISGMPPGQTSYALQRGWNMLGPEASIPVPAPAQACGHSWHWNPAKHLYGEATQWVPTEGYWLFVDGPVTIELNGDLR